MKKKRFNEKEPMHKNAKFYYEKLINFSDIDHKKISNDKAKSILGRFCRLPVWLQNSTLNSLEELGMIKRNKTMIDILPID